MTTRRGTAVSELVGSLALLLAVPAAWAASVPTEAAGSRAQVLSASPPAGPAAPPAATPTAPRTPESPSPPGLWVAAPDAPAPPAPAPPVEVDIAGIGVIAPIDPVGVDRDGSMVIPGDAHRVGWYQHGAAPGSAGGSAVLAGHVDSRRQGRGAMFALRDAEVGEPVHVRLADGTVVAYRVVARELLPKAALPVAELFSSTGPPRLTLITCGGDYDRANGGYRDNVVVTAIPESPNVPPAAGDVEIPATTIRTPGIA